MHPPICRKIGSLIYKKHIFEYTYDLKFCDSLFDEEVSKKVINFINKFYKNCEIQKFGIGVLLDLHIEYQLKGNILWLNKIFLKCDNNRILNINKKANWITKMVIKTPLEYKTIFYFKNAKLLEIRKKKEKCIHPFKGIIKKYFYKE